MAGAGKITLKKRWYDSFGDQRTPALGFLELDSISRGLFLTDALLKKAPVQVICSQPVSSGKHVLLYFGDVASVEESHQEALKLSDETMVREVLIHGVHEGLVPFLDSLWNGHFEVQPQEAVGIVESKTLAATVLAGDRALKGADVHLCRMRLGQGIGGKGYFVLGGRQDEVEAALLAARVCLEEQESFCRVDLIPRPIDEAVEFF